MGGKKLIILTIFLILGVLVGLGIVNSDIINNLYLKYSGQISNIEQIVKNELPKIVEKQVNTPPPLIIEEKEERAQSFLTQQGVINFTNIHREKEGLPALQENSLLNQSALIKAQDMFNKQYFAHDSPEGIKIENLVENVGYEFITIGENLALGNFLNDEVLVQGWTDSPGHRANILNNRYSQIGVAVIKGTYQGNETWIGVQHFGLPLSACPQVDISLNEEIEENNEELKSMEEELEERKEELKEMRKERDSEYNEKAEEYNELIDEYNELISETKSLIEKYNSQIEAFNNCAL